MSNILDNLIAELSVSPNPEDASGPVLPQPEAGNGPIRTQNDTDRSQKADADDDLRAESADDPVPDGKASASLQSSPTSNLQKELDGTRQLVKSLRGQVEKLKSERDSWRQQGESAQQLLAEERKAAALQPKCSWWKRLMG
jgi:hypothetical protein